MPDFTPPSNNVRLFNTLIISLAAAMFTALKVDVRNGESIAAEYMLGKIDAPSFNFNKIEPLAFARTGYINQGDSLSLSVMIAAYDSNEVSKIRFGINSEDPGTWTETNGSITFVESKRPPKPVSIIAMSTFSLAILIKNGSKFLSTFCPNVCKI